MRTVWIALLVCFGSFGSLAEDIEFWDGLVLTNVRVVYCNPKEMFITCNDHGKTVTKNIQLASLSEALQKKYGYSGQKAVEFADEHDRRTEAYGQRRAKEDKQYEEMRKLAAERQVKEKPAGSLAGPGLVRTGTNDWQVLKSNHFHIYCRDSAEFAARVSSSMEDAFVKMLSRVDCIKGLDLAWSMENSTRLYIYSSQQELVSERKLPEWAAGCAIYSEKTICMINTEYAFKAVALHELGHQVFYDLMARRTIPDWISEGVAQWLEPEDSKVGRQTAIVKMKQNNSLFRLDELAKMKANGLDKAKADVFYCESLSVVGYLINVSGFDTFKLFCDQVLNRVSVDNAIGLCYPGKFRDVNELESAWAGAL